MFQFFMARKYFVVVNKIKLQRFPGVEIKSLSFGGCMRKQYFTMGICHHGDKSDMW